MAPAKGLEKDDKGHLKVDKEKVAERKELEIDEGKKIAVGDAIRQSAPLKAALTQSVASAASATTDPGSSSGASQRSIVTSPSKMGTDETKEAATPTSRAGLQRPSRLKAPSASDARTKALLEK